MGIRPRKAGAAIFPRVVRSVKTKCRGAGELAQKYRIRAAKIVESSESAAVRKAGEVALWGSFPQLICYSPRRFR